jgi:dGTPase
MAIDLGLNADIVDMACLAHDLGHPPFGHNGEKALNDWAANIGGFEGNAQTLRLLTRIEPKVFTTGGRSLGLNLTRASLDATCKYPWRLDQSVPHNDHPVKFGVYEDDLEIFTWLREGAPDRVKSVEAQVMDFADDVAYSVHDFEDAIVAKFVDLHALNDSAAESELLKKISEWTLDKFSMPELAEALQRLRANEYWLNTFDGSAEDLATLKNLTSSLIGRFVSKTIDAIVDASPADSMVRYGARIEVPIKVQLEIAVLKGIVSAFLMSHESRQPYYDNQRELLTELAEALLAQNGQNLDSYSSAAWIQAKSDAEKRRVIVDQVACLTDLSAKNLHERLTKAHA